MSCSLLHSPEHISLCLRAGRIGPSFYFPPGIKGLHAIFYNLRRTVERPSGGLGTQATQLCARHLSAFRLFEICRLYSGIHDSSLDFLCSSNMKARARFLAVLLATACTTSCSTLTKPIGASTSAAIANSTPNTATSGHQQPAADSLRERVVAQGVDPESPQGKDLIAFLAELERNRETPNQDKPISILALPADDRLRFLHDYNGAMNATPGDCEAYAHSKNIFALARTLSPAAFQSEIDMVKVRWLRHQSAQAQQYTTAELVEADARLDAVPMPEDISAPGRSPHAQECEINKTAVAAVDAMPYPLQAQATFELIRKLSHQPIAVDSVLANPQDYLDEVFDERQLAKSIRDRLPADGSIQLPFRRLVVDGEWISQLPGESGPISDAFINRHGNGVIAEVLTSTGRPKQAGVADFILADGFRDLRLQMVEGNGYATPLATLTDEQAAMPAPTNFTAGSTVDIQLAQPQPDGSATEQCKVEGRRAASKVFASLSGVAFDLRCTSRTREGKIVGENQSIWLPDYYITLNMSWKIDGKAGHLVIHHISIE